MRALASLVALTLALEAPLAHAEPPRLERVETVTEGGRSAAPWVLTAFGFVLAATGTTIFVLGTNKVSNGVADPLPTSASEINGRVSSISTGQSMQIVGAAVGGLGIAGMVGGLGWHFAERPERILLRPAVGAGYGGVAVDARF
ncbi:MAG: hypothetical protein ABIP39_12710 [Polyangiaceae bacterium]